MIKLEQFKEIADENLRDMNADERMVLRVRQLCNEHIIHARVRIPHAAIFAAAACVAVMAVSAGFLFRDNALQGRALGEAAPLTLTRARPTQMRTLSSKLATSESADGDSLPYGISSVGSFSEGYAPALSTTNLYGYVNEDNLWVVLPQYESAESVKNGQAEVVLQGKTLSIEIPPQK